MIPQGWVLIKNRPLNDPKNIHDIIKWDETAKKLPIGINDYKQIIEGGYIKSMDRFFKESIAWANEGV